MDPQCKPNPQKLTRALHRLASSNISSDRLLNRVIPQQEMPFGAAFFATPRPEIFELRPGYAKTRSFRRLRRSGTIIATEKVLTIDKLA